MRRAGRQRLRPRRPGVDVDVPRPSTSSWRGPVPPRVPGDPDEAAGAAPSGAGPVARPSARRARITALREHPGHPAQRRTLGGARRQGRRGSGRRTASRSHRRARKPRRRAPFEERFWAQLMLALYRLGIAGRRLAVLLAASKPARRGARHRAGPGGVRARTRRSSAKTRPWRGAGTAADVRGRTACAPVAPTTPGTASVDVGPQPVARRDSVETLGPLVAGARRRGRVRRPAQPSSRWPAWRVGERGAGEQLLVLDHRGARHRQDEADGRDRAGMRRRPAISCSTAGGTRSRCVRLRRFAKH